MLCVKRRWHPQIGAWKMTIVNLTRSTCFYCHRGDKRPDRLILCFVIFFLFYSGIKRRFSYWNVQPGGDIKHHSSDVAALEAQCVFLSVKVRRIVWLHIAVHIQASSHGQISAQAPDIVLLPGVWLRLQSQWHVSFWSENRQGHLKTTGQSTAHSRFCAELKGGTQLPPCCHAWTNIYDQLSFFFFFCALSFMHTKQHRMINIVRNAFKCL